MGKKSTRSPKVDCDPVLTASGLCDQDTEPRITTRLDGRAAQHDRYVDTDDMGGAPTIASK